MDKIKSTRFIVAMNAVLLSMLILGHLGASPLGSTAEASAPPKTPVNAATQRQRMIVALEEMNKSSKASRTALDAVSKKLDTSIELQRDLIRMLERGKAIVTVSNMDTGGHN